MCAAASASVAASTEGRLSLLLAGLIQPFYSRHIPRMNKGGLVSQSDFACLRFVCWSRCC